MILLSHWDDLCTGLDGNCQIAQKISVTMASSVSVQGGWYKMTCTDGCNNLDREVQRHNSQWNYITDKTGNNDYRTGKYNRLVSVWSEATRSYNVSSQWINSLSFWFLSILFTPNIEQTSDITLICVKWIRNNHHVGITV